MFLLENPVEIDDMGIAPFQETSRNVERHQGWAPRAKDKTGEIKAPGRINPGWPGQDINLWINQVIIIFGMVILVKIIKNQNKKINEN